MINQFGYSPEVPSGIIVVWPEQQSTIPSGWVLCDGSNGTPNLDGKYVKGVNDFVGQTGGSEFITMSISNMPRHKHSAWVSDAGNHRHSITAYKTDDDSDRSWGANYGASSRTQEPDEAGVSNAGEHTHDIINETSVGSGAPIDIKPLTLRVNFIMKL